MEPSPPLTRSSPTSRCHFTLVFPRCGSRSTRRRQPKFSRGWRVLEIDIGISYIDNEPIGRLSVVALYQEQYMLLVSARSPLAQLDEITWSEAGKLPLCLLTPDTQSRRIIDRMLGANGGSDPPTFELNSIMTLFTHVRTGHWASIIPARLIDTLDRPRQLKAIPLLSPAVKNTIGLLICGRAPYPPTVSAFIKVAQRVLGTVEFVPTREDA